MPKSVDVAPGYVISESEVVSYELEKLLIAVRATVDCIMEDPGNVCGLKLNIFRLDKDLSAAKYFAGNKIERILRKDGENGNQLIVEFPWAADGSGFGVLIFRNESERFVAEGATIALP